MALKVSYPRTLGRTQWTGTSVRMDILKGQGVSTGCLFKENGRRLRPETIVTESKGSRTLSVNLSH